MSFNFPDDADSGLSKVRDIAARIVHDASDGAAEPVTAEHAFQLAYAFQGLDELLSFPSASPLPNSWQRPRSQLSQNASDSFRALVKAAGAVLANIPQGKRDAFWFELFTAQRDACFWIQRCKETGV